MQFVEKDPSQSVPIILGLLRVWPKTNSTKEVMFLTEIEEILDIIPIEQFRLISRPLFVQIAKCIDSNHFQVAERALMLWHNEYVASTLIPDRLQEILHLTLPILSKHSKSHWNRNVQILILNALECFMTIDPLAFDSCVATLPEIEAKSVQRRRRLFECWQAVDGLNLKTTNDPAREQLYTLLRDNHADDCKNQSTSATTNNNTSTTSTPTIQPEDQPVIMTRRKSILPMDVNVYQELVDYSRSSSPRPEEDEVMKE